MAYICYPFINLAQICMNQMEKGKNWQLNLLESSEYYEEHQKRSTGRFQSPHYFTSQTGRQSLRNVNTHRSLRLYKADIRSHTHHTNILDLDYLLRARNLHYQHSSYSLQNLGLNRLHIVRHFTLLYMSNNQYFRSLHHRRRLRLHLSENSWHTIILNSSYPRWSLN